MNPKNLFVILALAALTGCSTGSGVIMAGRDEYTVVKSGKSGFVPLGKLKIKAYQEASAFAEKKDKAMKLVSVNEIPAGFGKFPQVEVRFRLLEKDAAPEEGLRRVEEAEILNSFDAEGRVTSSSGQYRESAPPPKGLERAAKYDLYEELRKLGELRKSNVITEGEFQAEKKKLMDGAAK